MFWQEDDDKGAVFQVPDDVQDLLFKIDCKSLPLDHGEALCDEILKHLPWMKDEAQAAIHQIHVAESANGWVRPDNPETDVLCVSKRTKMTIRLPQKRLVEVTELVGKTLDVNGHALTVGEFSTRKLSKLTTIFARYLDTRGEEDEALFLQDMAKQLADMDIRVKKMMSGKLVQHATREGTILTRKLMVSDLDVKESIQLQEQGMGDKKLLGLGIFMPHKGIDAVNKEQEK